MNPLEIELCNRIRLGDEKAFNVLFKIYYSPLCRYAYDILKGTEIAKEIVIDLFVKIWGTRETFTVTSSLKGYLYRSVHNLCLNHIRDKKTTNSINFISSDDNTNRTLLLNLETPPEILEKLFAEQLETDLIKAMEALPEQCRTIFYLCRFEGFTYPEIALKLNLALSTVKTQMLRAISKLKIEVEKQL
jgi:RNA polymerase sigma-70 factor, ECF subfamily